MKKLGIFCVFPPGSSLDEEGLGRYFDILIKSASLDTNWQTEFQVELVVAPWHKNWGQNVTYDSPVTLSTLRIKTFSGILLYLWGANKRFFKLQDKELRTRKINIPAIAWTMHKWSAGVIGVDKKNPLYVPIQSSCRFFARTVLFIVRRVRRRDFEKQVEDLNLATASIIESKSVGLRKLFDRAFKHESSVSISRMSSRFNFIYLAHNRFPIESKSNSVATLIPDVIPLQHLQLFANHSERWKNLQEEIAETCRKSNNWITFSHQTIAEASELSLLSPGTSTSVIPHSSRPPGREWADYETQISAGMSRQWVDYWWRRALLKVTNPLFQNNIFNERLFYCIYPTQYRPHKNLEQLISSWNEVVQTFPTLKLILTADPHKNPVLAEMVRALNLTHSVLFIPKMNGSELIAWTKRAQLVLSSSSTEGAMPFMVSEAMAADVPFLISDTAVAREILPKEIQAISFLESDHFAESIVKALKSRDRILAKQSEWYRGYQRSWADVWNDWLDVARRELNA